MIFSLAFIAPCARVIYVQFVPPLTKFIRKVALKVKHKIKNRKSAMQVEIDKLAEQYGVPTSELRMQIQGV